MQNYIARPMAEHNFEAVDRKIAEVEFFLQQMAKSSDLFEFNCFFSAYISACRTTTLALQYFKHLAGFFDWYEVHRKAMQGSALSRFFLDMRNEHVHGGPSPVTSASSQNGTSLFYFDRSLEVPDGEHRDVVSIARDYFRSLLEVIYDCYVQLGPHIDPQQFFTKEAFQEKGLGIEDAELLIWGWVCESLIEEGMSEDDRWHELRAHVGCCGINHLFHSYLGKVTPRPVLPDYLEDCQYTPEEEGWLHVPAGFSSLPGYWALYFPGRDPRDI